MSEKYSNLAENIKKLMAETNHFYNNFPDIVLRYLYVAQKNRNWDLYIDVMRHSQGAKRITSKWNIEKLCTFPPLPSEQDLKACQQGLKK